MLTVDPYYDFTIYNKFLNSLKNNGVDFNEYICYWGDYKWYLDIPDQVIIDFDNPSNTDILKMVSKIKPIEAHQEFACMRKSRAKTKSDALTYLINDAYRDGLTSKESVFFNAKNGDHAKELSKKYGTIWFMGSYRQRSINLCLSHNYYILMENNLDILAKKSDCSNDIIEMEIKVNRYDIRKPGAIKRYFNTPRYEDGKYITFPKAPYRSIGK